MTNGNYIYLEVGIFIKIHVLCSTVDFMNFVVYELL